MFDFIRNFISRFFTGNNFETVEYPEIVDESPGEEMLVQAPSEKELLAMTKTDLDEFAEEVYGIKLDRRRTKQVMVDQFFDEYERKDGRV